MCRILRNKLFFGVGRNTLKHYEYNNAVYLGNDKNKYLALIKAKSDDITSCVINEKCKVIADNAFYCCCSLVSVTIPDGVISIGKRAFWECNSLTSIIIPEGVVSIGSYAFCNCDKLESVTLPDGIISIGDGVFSGCGSLISIVIPESVTEIGFCAFGWCYKLTSVTFEDPNGWYVSENRAATSGTDLTLTDPEQNAEYLKSTYCYYYWKRK